MSETAGPVSRARRSVAALETLATIRAQGRTIATDTERATLADWSGWGPMAPMFAPKDNTWAQIAEQVRDLLPDADVTTGEAGTYSAFYTPEPVARAMWEILTSLGYAGGPVFEPGCGAGVFMATAPATAQMVGVDRDPTSADICRLLHPAATVHTGEIQSTRMPGRFAAAIGNVPFGNVKVFDPDAPAEVRQSIHNYCIWRAVSQLADGGLAVLLTSRHTMDAGGDLVRRIIGQHADFLGAIRLPNGGLDGGTQALADILILRRKDGSKTKGRDWGVSERSFELGEYVNLWWRDQPSTVLGTMRRGATTQYGLSIMVDPHPDAAPLAEQITRAAVPLVAHAHSVGLGWRAPADVTALAAGPAVADAQGRPDGTLVNDGATVSRVEGGRLVPLAKPGRELLALLHLRDLAVTLVAAEANHDTPDTDIEPLRAQCATAYGAYVAKFGPLNRCTIVEGPPDEDTGMPTYTRRNPPMGGFRTDPDAALVFALEVFDEETQQAQPAPILAERQNRPAVRPMHTTDPGEAFAWCLDRKAGMVDLDYIAALLQVPVGEVPGLLGERVYLDPGSRRWVERSEYLSGNVRVKHRTAALAAAANPQFTRNVEALAAVVPVWLDADKITANLGAPWIPASDVAQFVRELLGRRIGVRYLAAINQWEIDVDNNSRESVAASEEWGTPDVDAYRLIQLACNGKAPVVYREERSPSGEWVKRKDVDASLLASTKQQAIKDRFSEWVWECPQRTRRLVAEYNERFNSHAARAFHGAHITVDGIASWFTPYPHQREFTARALATRSALCGLPVGSGKTATMGMVAAKLRQTGLIRKPMMVVPNHLIEQVARELRQLFPAARILAQDAETIRANRRAFAARCATQDWDLVIITHSAFDVMPMHPDTEAAYLETQADALRQSIAEACPDGRLEGRMIKAAAKRLDTMRARIMELRHRARGSDHGVTFEQLGVDYLMIDEAHYYKNLALPCRTEGFSVKPSKRATNLDMKLDWLAQRGGGRYASLYTGTPVSNTMLELYVVLHYTMPDYLDSIGLGSADAWCAAFVQMVTSVDVTVDGGGFQLKTRPALFVNAPELRLLLSQVADIRTAEQLGLPRPGIEERVVVCPPTTAQAGYSAHLVARVEDVKRNGRNPGPGADNMLAICGDGRRMATDPALVGLRDPEPGKLHRVAAEVIAQWREAPDELQIVFLDLGTPNKDKGTQTYGRLRRLLTEQGMPVGRIRFIHDADSTGAKAALFAECRAGKVSVIVGSTDKLGVGTNIQHRVIHMHHVDAPYRPADVEQRKGRGQRPGNRHAVVRNTVYVTQRTFDAYMWQMLHRKAAFIAQVMSGNLDRTIEDVAPDFVMSAAAIKAAATDQPLLIEKAEIEAELKRLRNLERGHRQMVARLDRDIPTMVERAGILEAEAAAWQAIADQPPTLTDADGQRLHDLAASFRAWRTVDTQFGAVRVKAGMWHTQSERPESHPLLTLDAGAGPVELRAWTFWKPEQLLAALAKLIGSAADCARARRDKATGLRSEIDAARDVVGRPFAQAGELAGKVARLDQIEAELRQAASDADQPPADAIVIDRPADPDGDDLDLGDLDEVFGDLMSELEAEVDAAFTDVFGDDLADLIA